MAHLFGTLRELWQAALASVIPTDEGGDDEQHAEVEEEELAPVEDVEQRRGDNEEFKDDQTQGESENEELESESKDEESDEHRPEAPRAEFHPARTSGLTEFSLSQKQALVANANFKLEPVWVGDSVYSGFTLFVQQMSLFIALFLRILEPATGSVIAASVVVGSVIWGLFYESTRLMKPALDFLALGLVLSPELELEVDEFVLAALFAACAVQFAITVEQSFKSSLANRRYREYVTNKLNREVYAVSRRENGYSCIARTLDVCTFIALSLTYVHVAMLTVVLYFIPCCTCWPSCLQHYVRIGRVVRELKARFNGSFLRRVELSEVVVQQYIEGFSTTTDEITEREARARIFRDLHVFALRSSADYVWSLVSDLQVENLRLIENTTGVTETRYTTRYQQEGVGLVKRPVVDDDLRTIATLFHPVAKPLLVLLATLRLTILDEIVMLSVNIITLALAVDKFDAGVTLPLNDTLVL